MQKHALPSEMPALCVHGASHICIVFFLLALHYMYFCIVDLQTCCLSWCSLTTLGFSRCFSCLNCGVRVSLRSFCSQINVFEIALVIWAVMLSFNFRWHGFLAGSNSPSPPCLWWSKWWAHAMSTRWMQMSADVLASVSAHFRNVKLAYMLMYLQCRWP